MSIRFTIAIASGKGGVGKSTTAVNLSLALQGQGYRVGLLDADIYGPSQPSLLGVTQAAEITDNKRLIPIQAHGIKTMSIGYLTQAKTPLIWRGPMATGALLQLYKDTEWGDLDFLILDLPPGTGDIQLTLAQKIPLSGAVVVTTPQEIALHDVRRACEMFVKVSVPLLGVVENMSTHTCSHCGHEESIFGDGGGQKLANEYKLPLLGSLPLNSAIQENSDHGIPIVIADVQSASSKTYQRIADNLVKELDLQHPSASSTFPTIEIRND